MRQAPSASCSPGALAPCTCQQRRERLATSVGPVAPAASLVLPNRRVYKMWRMGYDGGYTAQLVATWHVQHKIRNEINSQHWPSTMAQGQWCNCRGSGLRGVVRRGLKRGVAEVVNCIQAWPGPRAGARALGAPAWRGPPPAPAHCINTSAFRGTSRTCRRAACQRSCRPWSAGRPAGRRAGGGAQAQAQALSQPPWWPRPAAAARASWPRGPMGC